MHDSSNPIVNNSQTAREEAALRQWKDLTPGQKEAVRAIHLWLQGFCVDAEKADPEKRRGERSEYGFLPQIDETRPSNVILIDGERGSGKSTVLVFLMSFWRSLFLNGVDTALQKHGIPSESEPGQLCWFEHLRSRKQLIPLKQLDLQPMPHSTSLLTWLARRLYDVLEDVTQEHGSEGNERCSGPPWVPGTDREMASQRAWRAFLASASRWNGNLTERKGQLDPEAYATELDEAVRSHLDLPHRWRELVDALVEDAKRVLRPKIESRPVLILPIDDADMNPHLCVQLLELIRMLWHRRVVVLLTGNSKLFQEVLRCHYLGSLRKPLERTVVRQEHHDLFGSEVTAARLADAKYDSVVPDHHRFKLHPLGWSDNNLIRDFLEPKHATTGVALSEYVDQDTESAIPGNLRALTDLGHWRSTQALSCDKAVEHLWQLAIDNPCVTHDERRVLREVVKLAGDSALIWVDSGSLSISPEAQPALAGTTYGGARFTVSRAISFAVRASGTVSATRSITAALILATNVANDHLPPRVGGRRLVHSFPNSYPAVKIVWPREKGQMRSDVFHWPLPNWRPFKKWLLFSRAWDLALNHLELRPDQMTLRDLAWVFCHLVYRTHKASTWEKLRQDVDRFAKALSSIDLKMLGPDLVSWSGEGERPTKNPRKRPVDDQAFRDWAATRAILLAAPESGLSKTDAEALIDGWFAAWNAPDVLKNAEEGNDILKAVQAERGQRALGDPTDSEDRNSYEVLQRIDADPSHPWMTILTATLGHQPEEPQPEPPA